MMLDVDAEVKRERVARLCLVLVDGGAVQVGVPAPQRSALHIKLPLQLNLCTSKVL
jgi:hypothetical protein